MLKYLFKIFTILVISFICINSVFADSITSYISTVTVHKDGTFTVKDEIEYNFDQSRHGIFRKIPLGLGNRKEISITTESVLDEFGNEYKFGTNIDQDRNYTIKVGDPDVEISGSHKYIINYKVSGGLRYFPEFDELYWNVFGADWEFLFNNGKFIVDLSELGTVPKEINCYTGLSGTKGENKCLVDNSLVILDSVAGGGYDMTVSVTFQKGLVAELLPKERSFLDVFVNPFSIFFIFFIFCFSPLFYFLYREIKQYFHNKVKKAIVISYEPPKDLSVFDIGRIIDTDFNGREIAATLLEQAVRGAIVIMEKQKTFFKNQEYLIEVKSVEKMTMDGMSVLSLMAKGSSEYSLAEIFSQEKTKQTLLENGTIIDTANSFINYTEFSKLNRANLTALIKEGIFSKNSSVNDLELLTEKGLEIKSQILGFKDFLETTDKGKYDSFKDDLTQSLYEKYLPYAVLFGVEAIWIKHFDSVVISQPHWYSGANFNQMSFGTSFSDAFSVGSVTTSTSSGSGGSGSSGGGGGGGGGGSW